MAATACCCFSVIIAVMLVISALDERQHLARTVNAEE
jgi:hypothetical protein